MFDSRYEVILADTSESRALHRQVRYQVFCVERRFEKVEAFPGLEERDLWDQRSRQFVVRERHTAAAVAAVRIILPAGGLLPVEQLGCVTESPPVPFRRNQIAEVSRICVVRGEVEPVASRTWAKLGREVAPVKSDDESAVLLGLIRAIIGYSWNHDIPYLYMLVTQPFARLLKRLGVVCTQVGAGIEHRGLRAPYFIDVDGSWIGITARSDQIAAMFAKYHLSYFSDAEQGCKRSLTVYPRPAVADNQRSKLAA